LQLVFDDEEAQMETVGTFEAKTHLTQLLNRVAKGEKITISKRGVPVAILQPADSSKRMTVRDVIDQLKQFRRDHRLDGLFIHDMIEEGRR
jgi:prevent-host-death family protein